MAAEHLSQPSMAADSHQPLVGVFVADDSDVVLYYADTPQASGQSPSRAAEALAVIGAWAHMDWDTLADSLDRIRHDSQPTPPIALDDV